MNREKQNQSELETNTGETLVKQPKSSRYSILREIGKYVLVAVSFLAIGAAIGGLAGKIYNYHQDRTIEAANKTIPELIRMIPL